jgi:hypothetical protein
MVADLVAWCDREVEVLRAIVDRDDLWAPQVDQRPPEMILRVLFTEAKPPDWRPNLLVRRGGPRYDEMCGRARKPDEADVRDYEWHPDGIKVSLTWWAFAEGSSSQWQAPTDLTASPQLAKIRPARSGGRGNAPTPSSPSCLATMTSPSRCTARWVRFTARGIGATRARTVGVGRLAPLTPPSRAKGAVADAQAAAPARPGAYFRLAILFKDSGPPLSLAAN